MALGDLIEAIEPLEGMPGTMITLTGAFEAEAEYEVRFDTVAVVGYALAGGAAGGDGAGVASGAGTGAGFDGWGAVGCRGV